MNEFACLNIFDWTRSELWRYPRYSPTFRDSFQFKEFKKVSFQDGLVFQCIWSFATHQPPSPTMRLSTCCLPFWWGPIEIDSDWVVDHITNPKFPVGMSRLSRLPGHKKWPALDFLGNGSNVVFVFYSWLSCMKMQGCFLYLGTELLWPLRFYYHEFHLQVFLFCIHDLHDMFHCSLFFLSSASNTLKSSFWLKFATCGRFQQATLVV